MKRTLIILISIALVLLVSCSIEVETHEHDFACGTLITHVDSTCYTDGYESRKCKYCDAEEITTIPAPLAHIKDSGTVAIVEGHEITTYNCALCGAYLETAVEHHVSEDWDSDSSGHWHPYTCGCNMHADEAPHFWEQSTSTYGGGCETIKLTTSVCAICGYTSTSARIIKNHVAGEPVLEGNITITRCTVCGEILSVE